MTLLVGCSSADAGLDTDGSQTTGSDAATTTGKTETGVTGPTPTSGGDETGDPGGSTFGASVTDGELTTSGPSTGGVESTGGLETGTAASASDSGSETGTDAASSTGGVGEDLDGDGVPDGDDNCEAVPNDDQLDTDMDGIGDACEDDDDDDDDGIPDANDNCPLVPNELQEDLDKDNVGDACDPDIDGDGVENPVDNCPVIVNPDQKDLDNDKIGDVCDPDKDGDSIPDDADVFPDQPNQPGVVIPKKMYAHSSSALSTVDVVDYSVVTIGNFQWPADGGGHQMTDIAIDRYGVLYGVTFDRAYVCNPTTAQCFNLGTLPGSYNGLTWIPAGTLDPNKDSLIGISNAGQWTHLKIMNGQVSSVQLGTYGAGYTSAGDAFSIEGVGTFAAVNKAGVNSTVIVTVDPLTGKVIEELATTNGFSSVYGLAGWEGLILAFDSSGTIIKIDPGTKVVTNLGKKAVSWWGAGVGTILPQ